MLPSWWWCQSLGLFPAAAIWSVRHWALWEHVFLQPGIIAVGNLICEDFQSNVKVLPLCFVASAGLRKAGEERAWNKSLCSRQAEYEGYLRTKEIHLWQEQNTVIILLSQHTLLSTAYCQQMLRNNKRDGVKSLLAQLFGKQNNWKQTHSTMEKSQSPPTE